uniref:Uncharacterized protein n=1 Tax=Rhizophora mucronata TaxID=61149 RepID=A0A2P2P4B0_RHIMU
MLLSGHLHRYVILVREEICRSNHTSNFTTKGGNLQ